MAGTYRSTPVLCGKASSEIGPVVRRSCLPQTLFPGLGPFLSLRTACRFHFVLLTCFYRSIYSRLLSGRRGNLAWAPLVGRRTDEVCQPCTPDCRAHVLDHYSSLANGMRRHRWQRWRRKNRNERPKRSGRFIGCRRKRAGRAELDGQLEGDSL